MLPFFRKYFEPKVQFNGNPNLDHEVLLFRILLKSNYARLLHNLLTTNNITEDKQQFLYKHFNRSFIMDLSNPDGRGKMKITRMTINENSTSFDFEGKVD